MTNVHGISVAGGTFPAQIWHRFMQASLRYSPPQRFATSGEAPQWKAVTGLQHVYYFPRTTTAENPPGTDLIFPVLAPTVSPPPGRRPG
jgi:hypothetical protein